MKHLKRFTESIKLDRPLCFMFNDNFHENDLLYNSYARYNSIRMPFWETDISSLNNYTVMINIHDDGPNGTFIVHNDIVGILMRTDDFTISFTISEYNNRKFKEDKPIEIDLSNIDIKNNYWKTDDGKKQLNIKLDWSFVIKKDENKIIAIIPYKFYIFDDTDYEIISYSEYTSNEKTQKITPDMLGYITYQEKFNINPL